MTQVKDSFFSRLIKGLAGTRLAMATKIQDLMAKSTIVNDALFDELEEILILSDVGVSTSANLISDLRAAVKANRINQPQQVLPILKDIMIKSLSTGEAGLKIPGEGLGVIMVVGVNGSGKTTTIGKLAHLFRNRSKKVVVGAADTFRAAAIEQVKTWAERAGAEVVSHREGGDPAAVAYDAIEAGLARKADVVMIDTAGRLHTKVNLMEELKKVRRIVSSRLAGAPHETLLVVDSTTGQNVIQQAKIFSDCVGVTGIVLTKLDGTSKGGIVLAVQAEMGIPVKLVGVGEGIDDLREFNPDQFVNGIFTTKMESGERQD